MRAIACGLPVTSYQSFIVRQLCCHGKRRKPEKELLAPGRGGGGGEGTATRSTATHGDQRSQIAPGFSQLQLKREPSRITDHVTTLV